MAQGASPYEIRDAFFFSVEKKCSQKDLSTSCFFTNNAVLYTAKPKIANINVYFTKFVTGGMRMDQLDKTILEALHKDARRPFTDVAQELGISEGTVRNRVARLLENKTVQFVGLIDPNQMGYDAPAMIGVTVQSNLLEAAAKEIALFPEVSYLVMISGEYDLIVEVLCEDREHLASFLNQKLRQVKGVLRTQSFMILRTFKMSHGAEPSFNTVKENS